MNQRVVAIHQRDRSFNKNNQRGKKSDRNARICRIFAWIEMRIRA